MTIRDAISGALPPAGYLAAHLYDFVEEPLRERRHLQDHFVKGAGTFSFICPHDRFQSWHRDAAPRRAATVALGLVAYAAQAAVWAPLGVLAGLAAGPVYLVGGRESVRQHLAEFYMPVGGALIVLTIGAYVTCMVGGYLLVAGRLA